MKEEWRKIKGMCKKYEISSYGRLKIPNYKNTKKDFITTAKSTCPGGYLRYYLSVKKGSNQAFLAHRLVALAFIKNKDPKNLTQVNHKDGVKTNNHVDNLEWCNQSQNMRHAFDNGLAKSGEDHRGAKLKNNEIEVIKKMINTGKISQHHLADIFNVNVMTINRIHKGKSWKRA